MQHRVVTNSACVSDKSGRSWCQPDVTLAVLEGTLATMTLVNLTILCEPHSTVVGQLNNNMSTSWQPHHTFKLQTVNQISFPICSSYLAQLYRDLFSSQTSLSNKQNSNIVDPLFLSASYTTMTRSTHVPIHSPTSSWDPVTMYIIARKLPYLSNFPLFQCHEFVKIVWHHESDDGR